MPATTLRSAKTLSGSKQSGEAATQRPACGTSTLAAHAPWLLLCLLLAGGAWYVSAIHYGPGSWVDAVDYAVVGKSLVLEHKFPPAAMRYQDFLAAGADISQPETAMVYPNLLFSMAIGVIGLFRDDFSLLNGIWLNCAISLLFASAAYGLVFSLTREKVLSVLFVGLTLLLAFEHLGRPLTDASLLLFLSLSVWATTRGRPVAAGLFLGTGFLFREQALLFFPFLPLLAPNELRVRTYVANLLRQSVFFLPCLALSKIGTLLLLDGGSFSDFYLGSTTRAVQFTLQGMLTAGKHFADGLRITCIPLLFLAYLLAGKQLPGLCKRLALLAFIQMGIVCVLWNHKALPERYLIYSHFLLLLAVVIALPQARRKNMLIAALLAASIFSQRLEISQKIRSMLKPETSFAAMVATIHAPERLQEIFPPGSVLLSSPGQLPALILKDCIFIRVPAYSEFVLNDNSAVDGILLRGGKYGWDERPFVQDAHGMRFDMVTIPGVRIPPGHRYYKRTGQKDN